MSIEGFFRPKRTLNCKGKIINLSSPLVMGVINITPDSFYDGGRIRHPLDAIKRAEELLGNGADILDIGAASSRPGAGIIEPVEERKRLMPSLKAISRQFPEAIISVDTYNSSTAMAAADNGAHMINDISSGRLDPEMFNTIGRLKLPYIIMHMQGRPDNMQQNPRYRNLVMDIASFFSEKLEILNSLGVHDIIIDPGFGFGKTVEQNYQLMANLEYFRIFDLPLMVGVSRKSMINRVLGSGPEDALNGTTVLNTIALLKGADILRVHDSREAEEAIKIVDFYKSQE